jgi:hypothetical protein
MGNSEKLPGMQRSEWHQHEADSLAEASADAKDRGYDEEARRLWNEAGKASERVVGDVLKELRGEE